MIWAVLLASAPAPASAVEVAFRQCADAYRSAITGKASPPSTFDCAERAGSAAAAPGTTLAFVEGYGAAVQAGRRYVEALNAEAGRRPGLTPARLQEMAASRARYRMALCRFYGSLTGGTVDRSNAAICAARDIDSQIGALLALMKEGGIIPNGR